ncbi:glycosyltransferase [Candidatus Collierbacteria bacterium]|nr:glycosyltransferase [Candidatus Collierbacteria bacterium]
MKIVFISRYQGKAERGVENYADGLAWRLGRKYQVKILTSFWQLFSKQTVAFQKRPGLKIIYPLNGYWQSLGCRIYTWLTGAKLVLGGHAGTGRDDRWNLFMFPDLFIAFSGKGYNWAKQVNPFIKIVKIPHGVNLEKFNPDVKPTDLDLERPRFVTAANLVPYKRVEKTIKAVARLKKGSLLILGDGPLEKKIDELGNKLLGPHRYLRLKVPHDQMTKYLNACDVFTLVSEESEAFGLVYLEALACNLTVVATDDSLRRELIGDAGLFIKNPEDSQGYARALEVAANTDWGDKPVKRAKKFDWEKTAGKYLEEFGGICGKIAQ